MLKSFAWTILNIYRPNEKEQNLNCSALFLYTKKWIVLFVDLVLLQKLGWWGSELFAGANEIADAISKILLWQNFNSERVKTSREASVS